MAEKKEGSEPPGVLLWEPKENRFICLCVDIITVGPDLFAFVLQNWATHAIPLFGLSSGGKEAKEAPENTAQRTVLLRQLWRTESERPASAHSCF